MANSWPVRRTLLQFLREYRWFFLIATILAIAFRLLFLFKFRHLTDDSLMYGDLAKNWMLHGVYGQTGATGPVPTFVRLPGYPLFLRLVWSIAGVEHYTAVLLVQIFADTVTCFFIADLARRLSSERAAKAAFLIAALCPFFANYAVVALTETLAIFFAALALDLAIAAMQSPQRRSLWTGCGIALAAGILLRPDGGMLLIAIGLYLLFGLLRTKEVRQLRSKFLGGILIAVFALAPLIPWTIRNWRTLHHFQPLAPYSANNPDEYVDKGFHQWVRSWIVDYASVEDIWFNMDSGGGGDVDLDNVPRRAFDNDDQLQRAVVLFKQYDDNNNVITPEMDDGFAALARDRIRAHPLRYYVKLPVMRALDLWLRPRTEMLPIDPHWWRYWDDPWDFGRAAALGVINLFYVLAAIVAIAKRKVRWLGLILLFFAIRTLFLAWMPNPEPRYMLECYPALLAMAGAAWTKKPKLAETR
jgi:4-amino-4-deoxy-L-arabinose transferase-like glycosyltransferase